MGDLVQGIGIDRRIPVVVGRGMFTIPDRATGLQVSSSVTPFTYGSWVELTSGIPWNVFIHAVQLSPPSISSSEVTWQMQIGTGSSGSEVVVSTFKLEANFLASLDGNVAKAASWLPFPILVPAWTRVVARSANDAAAANERYISLNVCRTQDEGVYV